MVKSTLFALVVLAAAAAAAEQPLEEQSGAPPSSSDGTEYWGRYDQALFSGDDAGFSGVTTAAFDESADDATHVIPASCDGECEDCEHCETCGSGRGCLALPRFYIQADALILECDNEARDQAVVIDQNSSASLIRTSDPSKGVEVAARVLAGYRFNDVTAVEVLCFGPLDWNASSTASGIGNLAIPGALGVASLDFFGADVIQVDYSTELENAEINVARFLCHGHCLELLGGFRYLTVDEAFNINSTDFDTGSSDYNVQTENTLYGGQLGLRARHQLRWVGFEATGKAGIFANDSDQTQFVNDFPPPFMLRPQRSASVSGTAFVGDFTFVTSISLNELWSLRLGYHLLWIDDVALAADQLDFTNTPTSGSFIDDNGRLFTHGGILGLERRW